MAKKKKTSRLVGFARLKVTDPDKLQAIARKAGQIAQKKHGKWIRWTKTEARAMARTGGKAVQKTYRKKGHPLQIAQLKREAASRKIKAGIRKKKAQKAIGPKPGSPSSALPYTDTAPIAQEMEPEPVKDVANG